jgi:aryl-alcohol dehydrogenase-like predicted oxidoreductase
MQYRRLGKTGWNVSSISLGCWGIRGQWGPVAEDEAIRTMHAAIDAGVNLFDTADAYGPHDLLPWCAGSDVGTLIRGPIAQGVLAGKFTRETRFEDSVRRGWNEGAAREQFLQRLGYVERIRFLERPGRALAQAALQWVLANPAVTCAMPGAKSVEQARANAEAADGSLSADELARLRALTPVAAG